MVKIYRNFASESIKKIIRYKGRQKPGPDNIGLHLNLLYELREELAKPISELFKHSIDKGSIPTQLKTATVIPSLKKEIRQTLKTRPVSLICIVGKLLEAILQDEIVEQLTKLN